MMPLNRLQIAGTLVQAARQILESREVVAFEVSFADGIVKCIARSPRDRLAALQMSFGADIVVGGKLSTDRDGVLYIEANRIERPGEFESRLAYRAPKRRLSQPVSPNTAISAYRG